MQEDCSSVQRILSVGDWAQANRDETGASRRGSSRYYKAAERLAVYGCCLAVCEAAEATPDARRGPPSSVPRERDSRPAGRARYNRDSPVPGGARCRLAEVAGGT